MSPFLLVLAGLAAYSYSISIEALQGTNESLKMRFIVLECIIPFAAAGAALQFKKAKKNRFIFGMFGFFAGFLIALDVFVLAM
ncbi:hypothetical protein, partial [Acinetobacter baumannii]|uniref:hypothetical protein n=1 Tax=Acinetobacter baumannii TaxID=470 RepID=UPI00129E5C9F